MDDKENEFEGRFGKKEFAEYAKHFNNDIAYALLKKLRKATRKMPAAGATGKIVSALGHLLSALKNPATPKKMKALIIGTIGYIILPTDLVPDLLPGVGYIDDLGVAAITIGMVITYSNFRLEELDAEIDAESK